MGRDVWSFNSIF